MSMITILLLTALALTSAWLVGGVLARPVLRTGKTDRDEIDGTAQELFQRWSGQ